MKKTSQRTTFGAIGDRLDIKVGFACNNSCRFCVQGDKRKRFGQRTAGEVFEILKKNTERQGVVFTGGEPTLHPDILEMISRARSLGYRSIQVQTNGRLFAYRGFCEKVAEAGATEISPALHGFTKEQHEYLTRCEGSFHQTIKGIENLKAIGMKIITNTVINRSNFRNLPDVARLLVDLGVDQFQLAFVHPVGAAGQGENFESIVPRFEMIMPYVKAALDIGIDAGLVVMTEAIPFCLMRGYEQYIAENIMPGTKIFDAEGVIQEYKQYRIKEGKAKGKPCQECSANELCEGPWKEYPERFGWGEFIPC